jgi:LPS-assembly protein
MAVRFANPTGHERGSQRVRSCVRALAAAGIALAACATGLPLVGPAAAQQNPLLDPTLKANPDAPMLLQADELIYDNKHNKVRAQGNVEVFYNKHTLLADLIIYDRNENVLTAEGNVRIKEPDGAVVKADKIRLTDDFREGFIRSLSIKTKEEASITADRATRTNGNTTVFENGSFTPCKVCEDNPQKPPTWRIKATKIIHDKDAKTIEYEDMSFEFLGMPVAYFPYFKHPDPSRKRASGFLVPSVTSTGQLGVVTETPYYFALAPDYDATVTPVATTKAGGMLKGEFRQRLANGSYNVHLAGAYDDSPAANTPDNRKLRGSVVSKGNFEVGSLWNLGWDATVESDDAFRRFYKLDDVRATDRVSQLYLTGLGERSYFGLHGYHFGGLTLTDNQSATSFAHPLMDYNYIMGTPVVGGELSFNANAVALTRDDQISAIGWNGDWRHVAIPWAITVEINIIPSVDIRCLSRITSPATSPISVPSTYISDREILSTTLNDFFVSSRISPFFAITILEDFILRASAISACFLRCLNSPCTGIKNFGLVTVSMSFSSFDDPCPDT